MRIVHIVTDGNRCVEVFPYACADRLTCSDQHFVRSAIGRVQNVDFGQLDVLNTQIALQFATYVRLGVGRIPCVPFWVCTQQFCKQRVVVRTQAQRTPVNVVCFEETQYFLTRILITATITDRKNSRKEDSLLPLEGFIGFRYPTGFHIDQAQQC